MDISSIALQGLQRAQLQLDNSVQRLSGLGAATPDGAQVDTVSLSEEIVSLLSVKNQFATNIDILKVAKGMQNSLFNILG